MILIYYLIAWTVLGLFSYMTIYILCHRYAKSKDRLKKYEEQAAECFQFCLFLCFVIMPVGFVISLCFICMTLYHRYFDKEEEK